MFDNWSPSDWIGLLAFVVPILAASVTALAVTFKRLGRFETEHDLMKADIVGLQDEVKKIPALDTAIQLFGQGMTTMQAAFVDLRSEIRAERIETKDSLREIRHDVKNLLTGKVQPARRSREGDQT